MRIQRLIYGILMILVLSCREDRLETDIIQELKITSVSVLDCDFTSRAIASAAYGESVVGALGNNDELLATYYFYKPNEVYELPKSTSYICNGSTWTASTPIVRPNGNTDWDALNIAFYYNVNPDSYYEADVREFGYYVKQETNNGFTKYYDMLYASTSLSGKGQVSIAKAPTQCDVTINMKHACALLKIAQSDIKMEKNLNDFRVDSIMAQIGFYTEANILEEVVNVCFSKTGDNFVVIVPTQTALGKVCKLETVTFKCTDDKSPYKCTYSLDNSMKLLENKCYPFEVVLYRDLVEMTLGTTIETWTDKDLFGLYIGDDGFFEIWTGQDMHYFATMVNGGSFGCNGRMMGDEIDISAYPNWMPIGSPSTPYYGTFDGNGKTLKGLKIAASNTDVTGNNQGLFGYVEKGTIKDLTIIDSEVKGHDNVGLLVGYANQSTINNCTVSDLQVSGNNNVGGLVGLTDYSSFINCNVFKSGSGKVLSTAQNSVSNVGGVVGCIKNGLVYYCTASVDVLAENNLQNAQAGGFCGSTDGNVIFMACESKGFVSAPNAKRVGGFSGYVLPGATLLSCRSMSNVMGYKETWGAINDAGSLIGVLNGGHVYACYTTGNVNADANGKMIGKTENPLVSQVINCVTTETKISNIDGSNCLAPADNAANVLDKLRETTLVCTYDGKMWYPYKFWDETNKIAENILFPTYTVTKYEGE